MLDSLYIETKYAPAPEGMLPTPSETLFQFDTPVPPGGMPYFSAATREAIKPARNGYVLRTRYVLVGERYIPRETLVYPMDTYGAAFWGTLQ